VRYIAVVDKAIGLIATVAVMALAVAGCTSQSVDRKTPAPTRTVIAARTPTPAPTRAALSDLVVSPRGLGDIEIGQPVPNDSAALALVSFDPTACVSAELGVKAGDPNAGAWATTYPAVKNPYGPDAPFSVVTAEPTQTGAVAAIAIWTPGIHTDEGITVGDSLDKLKVAYPKFAQIVHGQVSDVYVVRGTSGELLIEVATELAGEPGYWAANETGTVLWMTVEPIGAEVYPIAGTDGGPSPCPTGA
jgi:hypothetical protein